jgi:hypothetical protein
VKKPVDAFFAGYITKKYGNHLAISACALLYGK